MLAAALATYAQVPVDEVERLMSLRPEAIYQDTTYQAWITSLDTILLSRELPHARAAYDRGLNPIKEKYKLAGTIMSGHTLCNWVLGFLMYPEKLRDMLDHHAAVPVQSVAAALPELLALLEEMPSGREEWQRALVIFTLPLLVRN
jgi:hypothetical protein